MNAILIHMVRGCLEAKPIQVDTHPMSIVLPVAEPNGFGQVSCPRQKLDLACGRMVICYVQEGIAPEIAAQAALSVVHQLSVAH